MLDEQNNKLRFKSELRESLVLPIFENFIIRLKNTFFSYKKNLQSEKNLKVSSEKISSIIKSTFVSRLVYPFPIGNMSNFDQEKKLNIVKSEILKKNVYDKKFLNEFCKTQGFNNFLEKYYNFEKSDRK